MTLEKSTEPVSTGRLHTLPNPPQASPPRRSKSYTQFHHQARARRKAQDDTDEPKASPRGGLKDERAFADWFDGLSDQLVESNHARYTEYLDQLELSRNHLDSLIEGTSSTLDLLTTLSTSFKAVELQTSTFQSRCEGILGEQRRLNSLADEVGQNLRYYSLLDPINRRLNAPGAGHSVRREDFPQMLTNLDQCLDYMKAHVSS